MAILLLLNVWSANKSNLEPRSYIDGSTARVGFLQDDYHTLIEILLRLSTAKYWSESLLISVRIAVLDISNDQKKL